MIKKILDWLTWPLRTLKNRKEQRELEKRLEELKKRDPFIYK
jgi:hypothetical protein